MGKTHGNCAEWTSESASQVMCMCGGMIPCWYSKMGNARKCPYWKPRVVELRLGMSSLEAEYYEGDVKPIVVIACCTDGNRYVVSEGYITKVRIVRWYERRYHYEEDGIGHYRITWYGSAPMEIVVVKGSEIRK